uniref:Stress responsive A/B barrel domain protein n=1 Tax=Kalmanozyma brasiliensis (strain GHG001) TaxID=1365824 RepID=V5GQR3_KALBG
MPVIHIVLVKVKQSVLSNGFDELKSKCEELKDLPIAKSKATEIKWGPPAYPGRNEGYNWGV